MPEHWLALDAEVKQFVAECEARVVPEESFNDLGWRIKTTFPDWYKRKLETIRECPQKLDRWCNATFFGKIGLVLCHGFGAGALEEEQEFAKRAARFVEAPLHAFRYRLYCYIKSLQCVIDAHNTARHRAHSRDQELSQTDRNMLARWSTIIGAEIEKVNAMVKEYHCCVIEHRLSGKESPPELTLQAKALEKAYEGIRNYLQATPGYAAEQALHKIRAEDGLLELEHHIRGYLKPA